MTSYRAPGTTRNRQIRDEVGGWIVGRFVVTIFLATHAAASPPPLVVPVAQTPFAGELERVDSVGDVTFRNGEGAERTLAFGELVRWSHPALPRRQTLIVLNDGSRLVAAAQWAGGAPVRLDGDELVVISEVWGEIRLPRQRVRGLVFLQYNRPLERLQLGRELLDAAAATDQVRLTNEDRVDGTLVQLAGGSLAIATQAGEAEIPLSRVEAIALGRPRDVSSDASPQNPAILIVGLDDGSLIVAASMRADDDELEIALPDGLRLEGGTCDNVACLQSLGGRFVYLSDLEPADYRHVPYLDLAWPYQRDRNVLGEPIVVGGRLYLKGLAMHSAGRLTYRLDGDYERFAAEVAIDDSARGRGSVVFGVHVLRDGRWQASYKSGTIRGGDQPQFVSVDIRAAQALTLTVDYADRGDELDHAVWLDARLVK